MNTYASVSGSVMYIPPRIEKTIPKMARALSNDNNGKTELQPTA